MKAFEQEFLVHHDCDVPSLKLVHSFLRIHFFLLSKIHAFQLGMSIVFSLLRNDTEMLVSVGNQTTTPQRALTPGQHLAPH